MSQLEMDAMLRELEDDYHRRRAIKPSKVVPCDGSCGGTAWVATDAEPPHLCWYCQQERRE